MKSFQPVKSLISLVSLLVGDDATGYVEYQQRLDGKTIIKWDKEELLKKPLADLIALANQMHYRINKL